MRLSSLIICTVIVAMLTACSAVNVFHENCAVANSFLSDDKYTKEELEEFLSNHSGGADVTLKVSIESLDKESTLGIKDHTWFRCGDMKTSSVLFVEWPWSGEDGYIESFTESIEGTSAKSVLLDVYTIDWVYYPRINKNSGLLTVGAANKNDDKHKSDYGFGVAFETYDECVVWIRANIKESLISPELLAPKYYLK